MQQCWRCKMKEFLQHSLLFDSYRWTDHREMQELYSRMLSEIPQGGFKPKTVESLKSHLRLFLCNLYVANYYEKPIAISLKAETSLICSRICLKDILHETATSR